MTPMGYVHHQYLYGELVKKKGKGMEYLLSRMLDAADFRTDEGIEAHAKAVRDLARKHGVPITLGPYIAKDPDFARPKIFCHSTRTWVLHDPLPSSIV